MNRVLFLALIFMAVLVSRVGFAESIGLRFTGGLFFGATLFGEDVAGSDRITGYVIYDTDASLTNQPPDCLDCASYRQDLVSGFYVEVGPLKLLSGSYLTTVFNDIAGLFPGTFDDVLRFEHTMGLDPPLLSDLHVNGIATPEGSVALALTASDITLADHQLPQNRVLANFLVGNLQIQDSAANTLLLGTIDFGSLQTFDLIPGDFNQDELVAENDYELWRSNYGSTTSPFGDANRDGRIDAADYTVWRDARDPVGQTVPEPSCGMLCLLLVVRYLAPSRGYRQHGHA